MDDIDDPVGLTGPLFDCSSDEEESVTTVEATCPRAGAEHHPEIRVQMMGKHHSLWAHVLSQSCIAAVKCLDKGWIALPTFPKRSCSVCELGASSGVLSIVCAQHGAAFVCATDFNEQLLLDTIRHNVRSNDVGTAVVEVVGHTWGTDVQPVLLALNTFQQQQQQQQQYNGSGYDVIVTSDTVFNHNCQSKLLHTMQRLLNPDSGVVFVFVVHHRPHLMAEDLKFFTLAEEQGWNVLPYLSLKMKPTFPEDEGDLRIRSTVHLYLMKRTEIHLADYTASK